jgi:hypothetical protein
MYLTSVIPQAKVCGNHIAANFSSRFCFIVMLMFIEYLTRDNGNLLLIVYAITVDLSQP